MAVTQPTFDIQEDWVLVHVHGVEKVTWHVLTEGKFPLGIQKNYI